MFQKILIANRGEIALRVLRAAKELGIQTVVVHSTADADAMHVRLADESVCIGPPPSRDSYLNIHQIVAACEITGADAVHPGYGFLSENARFADILAAHNITFIGPSGDHIRIMGDKIEAKRTVRRLGIPVVPGSDGAVSDEREARRIAAEIGYPVIIKAAAGGGGRGMKVARDEDDLEMALATARSEAGAAFGDDAVYIEKFLERPRHIEIQIFGDGKGKSVHMGERDCSLQRRHQKLVEEAPAPGVSARAREAMGEAAMRLAQAVGYVGAGTVEFLLDSDGHFHFLEVNTRLQVEHRVTEAITGVDLVEMQLRIARGEALPFAQADVRFDGHAIEARLCAEDAFAGFVPHSGAIAAWRIAHADGMLVDHALGPRVSPQFDSLLAKFVAHGRDREEARLRLVSALGGSSLLGVMTNRAFLLECLCAPRFVAADVDVGWLVEAASAWRAPAPDARWQAVASALWMHRAMRGHGMLANWSSNGERRSQVSLAAESSADTADTIDDEATKSARDSSRWHARLEAAHDGGFAVCIGSHRFLLRIESAESVSIDGHRQPVHVAFEGPALVPSRMWLDHAGFTADVVDAASLPSRRAGGETGGELRARMHGRIASIAVTEGHRVNAGQALLSIEAMKMEHVVSAPTSGRVAALAVTVGAQVSPATLLVRIEAEAG